MLHIPHMEDNEIDENKVITKHFLSSIDPLPSNTRPEDRHRAMSEMYGRAKEIDAECADLVEDIRPADMMREFLLPGETEKLSLRVVTMSGEPKSDLRKRTTPRTTTAPPTHVRALGTRLRS